MTPPLPPEREGATRRRRGGEGLSSDHGAEDKAYDRLPTHRSRELRNNPTHAERKLWGLIRNRQIAGIRFNLQVPIGPFICDFVARTVRVILEVDGGQHASHAGRDEARSHFLQGQGYCVIRFWNNDVLYSIEGVATTIEQALLNLPSRLARVEEGRGPEGEGLSSSETTGPPPAPPEDREGSKK